MPSEHARLSLSDAPAWVRCPGKIPACADLPESPPNDAAVRGTNTHALLEVCGQTDQSPQDVVDFGPPLGFDPDPEQIEAVEMCLEYAENRAAEFGGSVAYEVLSNPGAGFHPRREDCWGTADLAILDSKGSLVEIADLKTGFGLVEVGNAREPNYQLAAYALGLQPLADVVRLTVIQPHAPHSDGPIRSVDLSYAELVAVRDTLQASAEESDITPPILRPGDMQCRWCAAAGVCPALAARNVSLLRDAQALAPADPPDLPAGEPSLGDLLTAAKGVRRWLDAVEAEALRMLTAGEDLPGWKLVEGRGSRAWNCPEDKIEGRLRSWGLKSDDFAPRKLVSPAQAEKLATVAGVSERRMSGLKALITRKAGKPTLAPANDKRPALGAKSAFSDHIETIETK